MMKRRVRVLIADRLVHIRQSLQALLAAWPEIEVVGIAADKEAFGQNAVGHYYGGGRATAGGFEIPIGFLSGDHTEEYRQQKWQVCEAQVKHKLLGMIGVEQKRAD